MCLSLHVCASPLLIPLLQALDFESIAATKRHCRIVACSAVTGKGLLDGFDWLVQDISSRIYLLDH
jgi:ADP-ribosylation factor-like protein 2